MPSCASPAPRLARAVASVACAAIMRRDPLLASTTRRSKIVGVKLPFGPPLEPMLAKLARELPVGDEWLFEPKWDGFRTIVFRDGDEVYLQSRDGKPLNRYFPELGPALTRDLPRRVILD